MENSTEIQNSLHPDWSYNSVVYEMNIRQYTPEGTLKAAMKHLPRLKELGIDILWLMPIYPIGVKGRKGTYGSYYAIQDYCAVNPEFGTMKDFEKFLEKAHKLGFKLILDWVANHTSPDARWITECPADWYHRDANGEPEIRFDWTDIAALNYENKEMWQAMDSAMRFWLEKGIDGFRCDMACLVPMEFWRATIPGLRRDYPGIYMLAEGETPELHYDAFDASYRWDTFHLMDDIAQYKKGMHDLIGHLNYTQNEYPAHAFRLMFTSNHDENSWQGTEFERMGEAARAMAVLTFTLPNGQPLIYTGQEMGLNKRFQFFEKDPVEKWEENDFTDFYKYLIKVRHSNPALAAGERGGRFEILNTENNTLMFARTLPDNRVIVKVQMCYPWAWEIKKEY